MMETNTTEIWCDWQGKDADGIYCMAHIAEGRCFNCPYESDVDRENAEYPCCGYTPI